LTGTKLVNFNQNWD